MNEKELSTFEQRQVLRMADSYHYNGVLHRLHLSHDGAVVPRQLDEG